MSDQILLAFISIIGGLIATLGWVVKRVFVVIDANTRVNNQVSSVLIQIHEELNNHIKFTEPTIKTQDNIIFTQHEILKILKQILVILNKKIL